MMKYIHFMFILFQANGMLPALSLNNDVANIKIVNLTNEQFYTNTSDYGWGLEEDGFGRTDVNKKSGRTYTWNEKNELSVSADSRYNVNYIYGEGGERTAKVAHSSTGTTSETLYFNKMYSWHYDGAISDYTGNYSKNIFLGETRILTKVNRADTFTSEEHAKQYWYHSDHLGSASLITDYQGREYERIEYTPYGELWVERKTPTDNLDTIFRFSGKELDVETGNYYYGARYLDPRTSRWLSTDPALGDYIPGAPINDEAKKRNGNLPGMGGVFNVVNFHLYHYAGNNPVRYVDPDGKYAEVSLKGNKINIIIPVKFADGTSAEQKALFKSGAEKTWSGEIDGFVVTLTVEERSTGEYNNVTFATSTSKKDISKVDKAGKNMILYDKDLTEKYAEKAIGHETGHFMNLEDKYTTSIDENNKRKTTPNDKWEKNIMAGRAYYPAAEFAPKPESKSICSR